MKDKAETIKRQLLKKKAPEQKPLLLSTSLTVVNLTLSNRVSGGIETGHSYMFWGESSSCKTIIAHACLAEASVNPKFDDYQLVLDNPQQGALFDLRKFYGEPLVARLEPPRWGKNGERINSATIHDLYWHLEQRLNKAGKPCVYVLDDLDSLYHPGERDKYLKNAGKLMGKAEGKDDEDRSKVAGSFNISKAKVNSENMSWVNSALYKTQSILIIIVQARSNVGWGSQYNPLTHGGGTASKFYATDELLTTVRGQIDRTVPGRDKKKNIGMVARIQVRKNRQTGDVNPVEVNFLRKTGLDDIGTCVDWLIEWKHWKGESKHGVGKVSAPEFEWEGSKEKLIQKIEVEGKEGKIRNIVAGVWADIEESIEVKRKPRY